MNIPTWWLVLSGVFFAAAIVMTVLLAVLALQLTTMVKRLQVQIEQLTRRADEIGLEVRSIAQQVNRVTKTTSERAERFGGALDIVAAQVAGRSQWISAGLTVFTLVRTLMRGRRQG